MRYLTYLDTLLGIGGSSFDEADMFFGSVLYDNRLILDGEWREIPPEFFKNPLHRKMWKLMSKVGAQKKLVEPIWLSKSLANDPDFKKAGGVGYLADIIELGSEVNNLQSALAILTIKHACLTNHLTRSMSKR